MKYETKTEQKSTLRCRFCGKPFTPKRRWQLFCVDAHREAWYRAAYAKGKEALTNG